MTEEEQQVVRKAVRASHDVKTRRIRWVAIIVTVLAVLAFGVSGWIVYASTLNAANRGAELADTVKDECSRGMREGDSCEQAEDTEKAVEDAPTVTAVKGEKGDKGEPGRPPTPAEVYLAVNSWCSVGGRCRPPGPTTKQIDAAVAAWCGAEKCAGQDGTDGRDGTDGTDGQNATPEQISTAVAAWCSDGRCKGEKGDKGEPGEDGADGVSIVDVVCEEGTGTFTFTYSDGKTEEVSCEPGMPTEPAAPGPGEPAQSK